MKNHTDHQRIAREYITNKMRSRKDTAANTSRLPYERDNRRSNETERLQDIALQNGVTCEVRSTPLGIVISAASYGDYLLAKQAISPHTHRPISKDL